MQSLYENKMLRILVSVGVPLAALFLAAFCYFTKKTPPCIFYHTTGLYCFGCGAGRSLLALLHGEIYAAFRYHPLLLILLPFLSYYVAKVYLAFVFGRDLLPVPKIKNRWFGITLAAVVIAFWVLRNIPVYPFVLLAPTAV